jgi:hypothetical protein
LLVIVLGVFAVTGRPARGANPYRCAGGQAQASTKQFCGAASHELSRLAVDLNAMVARFVI